jgi:adenylyltransferase/sulfurtransferase
VDRLLIFNALDMKFREVAVRKNPKCRVCGEDPSIKTLIDEELPVCDLKGRPHP